MRGNAEWSPGTQGGADRTPILPSLATRHCDTKSTSVHQVPSSVCEPAPNTEDALRAPTYLLMVFSTKPFIQLKILYRFSERCHILHSSHVGRGQRALTWSQQLPPFSGPSPESRSSFQGVDICPNPVLVVPITDWALTSQDWLLEPQHWCQLPIPQPRLLFLVLDFLARALVFRGSDHWHLQLSLSKVSCSLPSPHF